MGLTAKQAMFVKEYLVDLNATQAAIAAGYEWESDSDGFHVYFLVDDKSGHIFYVGKGKGRRRFQHRSCQKNAIKAARITEIEGRYTEFVFAGGLLEADAYRLEKKMIEKLADYGLTNIACGIVSPVENQLKKVSAILDALVPFDQWRPPEWTKGFISRHGGAALFYNTYLDGLREIQARLVCDLNLISENQSG